MRASAKAVTKVTVVPVIVRACTLCGGPRQIGDPCAGCGNAAKPVILDLGVQAAWYSSFWKKLAWNMVGSRLAAHRARLANKES